MTPKKAPKRAQKPRKLTDNILELSVRTCNSFQMTYCNTLMIRGPTDARRISAWLTKFADWAEARERK